MEKYEAQKKYYEKKTDTLEAQKKHWEIKTENLKNKQPQSSNWLNWKTLGGGTGFVVSAGVGAYKKDAFKKFFITLFLKSKFLFFILIIKNG